MKFTLSNTIKLSLASILVISFITLNGCCSSDYIYVKIHKSAFIPDSYELNRDSLITGGFRICKTAQRFYYKAISLGGGGLSFTEFSIPPHLAKTQYGEYVIDYAKSTGIKIICNGLLTGIDEINPMKLEFVVTPTSVTAMISN